MCSLCRVSKLFNLYATPYLYSSVDIVASGSPWGVHQGYDSLVVGENRGLKFIRTLRFLPPQNRRQRRGLGGVSHEQSVKTYEFMTSLLFKIGCNVLSRFEWHLPSRPPPIALLLLRQETLTKVSWSIPARLCYDQNLPSHLSRAGGLTSALSSITILSVTTPNIHHIAAWLTWFPALKTLRMEWSPRMYSIFYSTHPTECFWAAIGLGGLQHLTTLKLKWADVSFLYLLPVVDRLTSLTLDRCRGVQYLLTGWRFKSSPSPIRLRKLWLLSARGCSQTSIHHFLRAFGGLEELALYSSHQARGFMYVPTGICQHQDTLKCLLLDTPGVRYGSRFARSHVCMHKGEAVFLASCLSHYPCLRSLALPVDLTLMPDATVAALVGRVHCFQLHLRAVLPQHPLAQAIANAVARGFSPAATIAGDMVGELGARGATYHPYLRSYLRSKAERDRLKLCSEESRNPELRGPPSLRYISLFDGSTDEWVVVFEVLSWTAYPPVIRRMSKSERIALEKEHKILKENVV